MALETRPIPVLKGKAAKDFFKTLEKCTVSESRAEVREINRKMQAMIERAEKREREEQDD